MPDLVSHRSVADAFAERAAAHPQRAAVTIYRGSASPVHETVTYGELAERLERRAAGLAERLAPGERVLIALPTSTEFVEIYLACLAAGLVAVPVPAPSNAANAAGRIAAIAADCAPGLAITTEGDRAALVERLAEHGLGHIPVEAAGTAADGSAAAFTALPQERRPGHDALAVLQYSSGSTGSPKGAMLSHGSILADLQAFTVGGNVGADDVFGIWLPLHHDMGLFGQLTTALLCGAPIVLMQPTDFVRRPVEWFRMLDAFGITVTSGPNFAFDLCLRLITDQMLEDIDLSGLRVAFNGSEPIHVPTVAAFTKRFAGVGLRPEVVSPAYGLAEATVFVSTNPAGKAATVIVADPRLLESAERPELRATTAGEGKEVIGVGRPPALDLRIVDPQTRRVLPEHAIGEVWLRGPSVGSGYWNLPELSESNFRARLADEHEDEHVGGDGNEHAGGAGSDSGWLRTGDLGSVVDGELYVTGRIKEMVIVRGRNLFPQDLEEAARAAHDGLVGYVGAAFGVIAPDERVVLLHEVNPKLSAAELPAVASAVSQRLTVAFGVPIRNILLVRRGTVRRTTSGKIQRGTMRERFLAGDVEVLHAELEPAVRRISAGGDA